MFGYVVVDKPSLRIREYDYYRATYCGLCHAMGKCTGCLSRLTLSYDVTFFALLRGMLEEERVDIVKKRCIRHPIKSVPTLFASPSLEYSAYIGGVLCSGKIVDNINDEKGIKRTGAAFLRFFFSHMERKVKENVPEIYEFVNKKLAELSEIEKAKTASIDAPANVFGELMQELLSHGLTGNKKLIAKSVGLRLGRWVYIIDALDDYEKDRESGSYNPFVLLYGGEQFDDDAITSITKMLEAELALALSAIDLLDSDGDANRCEIIKNILCLGMPASVKRVLESKKDKE